MKRIGSRLEVINGLAMKTSGGLKVNDLIINKRGKVVSKKLHEKAIKQYGGTVNININKYKSITKLHNIPNNLKMYQENMIGQTAKLNLMTNHNLNVQSPYKYIIKKKFNNETEYEHEKSIFAVLLSLTPQIKNIVKLIKVIDDENTIYMEYCGKSLYYHILNNEGPTKYKDILIFMKTLTKIILDLHGNGLILYDIKPDNITLMHDNDYENNVRLIDVGGINVFTTTLSQLPIEIYARLTDNTRNDYIEYNPATIRLKIMGDKLFLNNPKKFVYSALAGTLFTILFRFSIFNKSCIGCETWKKFYIRYFINKNLFNSINNIFKPNKKIVGDPPNSNFKKLCELIDRYYFAKNDEYLTAIYNDLTTTIDKITNILTIKKPINQRYTRM